ncbi:MAG: alpha/beta hydrolase [Nitrosomonadales bacterium]|nr:alpha/beta hydrolase [Nitrosomonadales bacterium]
MPSQRNVIFAGPAGQLEGVLHLPDAAPRAIAVVAHPLPTMGGTMGNKVVTTLTKAFTELGCAALRFNFRGVGNSAGEFDEGDGEIEDVLAVVHHARREYGHLPLILSGFSFGGYVQARAAQQLHPQRLVLVAPAVGRSVPSFENSTGMPHVPHNTLLIHGEQDDVVPLSEVMEWARPQNLPIVVLPGAEHFFHGRLHQIKQIVMQHFQGQQL